MDQFFINLPAKPFQDSITYRSEVLLLGSCFAENIGKKLKSHKFKTTTNPFGIIFHPEAILTLIERTILQKEYTEKDLFFHNELWHCFEVHSQFSNSNKIELLKKLNAILKQTYDIISSASHIVLTYGTAWGYMKQHKIVANCHKIPQKQFQKKLSSVNEIQQAISKACEAIFKINPTIQIIGTISPVRHIKNGISENNRSKSHLIAALHTIIKNFNTVYYYPAYELVIDCLRDYRFYKSDLVHPNQIAIDFIWEHFKNTYLHDKETQLTLKKVHEIQLGMQHRPFNPKSETHQKFLRTLKEKKESLSKKYPDIKF